MGNIEASFGLLDLPLVIGLGRERKVGQKMVKDLVYPSVVLSSTLDYFGHR